MFLTRRVPEITPRQLADRIADSPDDVRLLDIRPLEEREYSNIGGEHIPIQELAQRLSELDDDRDREIVVYCRSGARSASVVAWLHSRGYVRAVNLAGGINGWSRTVNPSVRAY